MFRTTRVSYVTKYIHKYYRQVFDYFQEPVQLQIKPLGISEPYTFSASDEHVFSVDAPSLYRMRHPSPIPRCILFSLPRIFFFFFFYRLSHGERFALPLTSPAVFSPLNIKRGIYTQVKVQSKREMLVALVILDVLLDRQRSESRQNNAAMRHDAWTSAVNAAMWRIIIVVCTSFSCPPLGR